MFGCLFVFCCCCCFCLLLLWLYLPVYERRNFLPSTLGRISPTFSWDRIIIPKEFQPPPQNYWATVLHLHRKKKLCVWVERRYKRYLRHYWGKNIVCIEWFRLLSMPSVNSMLKFRCYKILIHFALSYLAVCQEKPQDCPSCYNVGPYKHVYPPANISINQLSCVPDISVNKTCPLFIHLVMSFGGAYTSSGAIPGIQVALDQINAKQDILPGYSLHYTLLDSQVCGNSWIL